MRLLLISMVVVHMDVRTGQRLHAIIVSGTMLLGFLFYFFYRPHFNPVIASTLPNWLLGSAPSFIFILMMTSLSTLCLGNSAKKSIFIPLGWLSFLSVFELFQTQSGSLLYRGTFDFNDLYAACLAAVIALFLLTFVSSTAIKPNRRWSVLPISLFAFSTLLGSGFQEPCDKDNDKISKECIKPVVLPWQELRKEITSDLSGNELLKRSGKIYVLDSWLFVVEKYRGIHIFDMSDKLNPLRLVYIPIAGALDLTIKNSILYSSAFTDLVMIDLDTLFQSSGVELVMSRQEDVFSYPSRTQFYPELYWMDYSKITSQSEGIVIGYETVSGKKILYGDEYDLYAEEKDRENNDDTVLCFVSVWLC
ncbi:MAG: hypothetical protein V7765_03850 [Oleispira sp.]